MSGFLPVDAKVSARRRLQFGNAAQVYDYRTRSEYRRQFCHAVEVVSDDDQVGMACKFVQRWHQQF